MSSGGPIVQTLDIKDYRGDYQNYGPFLGPCYDTGPNTGPNVGDPKRDYNFDNPIYRGQYEKLRPDSFIQRLGAA